MYLFPVTSGTKNSANFIYHLIELQLVAQDVKESSFPLLVWKKKYLHTCLQKWSMGMCHSFTLKRWFKVRELFPIAVGLWALSLWSFHFTRKDSWLMTRVVCWWYREVKRKRRLEDLVTNGRGTNFLDDRDYTFIRKQFLCLDSDNMKISRE